MNIYGSLANVKADLGITSTAQDSVLLRLLEEASRSVDEQTRRHFYALQNQVRYYQGTGAQLWLPDDVIAVTAIGVDKDGAGTYSTALALTTDYWLYPDNPLGNEPYWRVDLNPDGSQVLGWSRARRSIRITGTFGYSFETERVGGGAGQGAEVIDASETAIDVDAGHGLSVGETIVIDSEQMYVSAIATNTLTVVRGVNGSTATSHVDDSPVYRRRYPRPIEMAVELEAVRLRWEMQGGYGGTVAMSEAGNQSGNVSKFGVLYPAIRTKVAPYRRLAVA